MNITNSSDQIKQSKQTCTACGSSWQRPAASSWSQTCPETASGQHGPGSPAPVHPRRTVAGLPVLQSCRRKVETLVYDKKIKNIY